MARRPTLVEQAISVSIWQVEYFIQEDRKAGLARFQYERQRGTDRRELQVDFPIISLWINPRDGNCLRAHLRLQRNRRQITFYNDILRQRVLKYGYSSTEQRQIIASSASAQRVIFVGIEGDTPLSVYDYDIGNTVSYFPTKALALRAVIRHIEKHRAIGGLNYASLNTVSDEVLLQLGFTKIDDVMGNGQPMWVGSPEILRSSDWRMESRRQEMADSFLLLLNEELQKPMEKAA